MEYEAERFYRKTAEATRDVSVRQLLTELAEAEAEHENLAHKLGETILTKDARAKEDETQRRMFLLQYVQPGLVGLMDGSVSTLAPVFAAAFATHNTWETFLVGMAASVGAGISMGFAEALSDDGSLTGRGTPWIRGTVCGLMTTIGGVGHTLPYLIPDFWVATVARHRRGGGRARGHFLDPLPLHGHAIPFGGIPGHGRRRAGLHRRDIDRQLLNFTVVVSSPTATRKIRRCSSWPISPTRIWRRCHAPIRASSCPSAGSATSTGCASAAAIHRADMLAALVADLKGQAPDHIAVTGDLVNLSLTNEFAPALRLARRPRRPARRHASCPAITIPTCARPATSRSATGATSCAATAAKAFPSCGGAARWR